MESPCVNLCRINENNFCKGCKRSLEEIVAWANLTTERRIHIMRELKHRQIETKHK
jgi:predicted Fe-S protein YdhL (DUF1289 family)